MRSRCPDGKKEAAGYPGGLLLLDMLMGSELCVNHGAADACRPASGVMGEDADRPLLPSRFLVW